MRRWASLLAEAAQSKVAKRETGHLLQLSSHCCPRHLQDEDEVVDRAVALVEVMLCCLLILSVILELLDDIGVFQEPQQDLLREVGGLERLHF